MLVLSVLVTRGPGVPVSVLLRGTMSMKDALQDTSPTLSKESATCPERDGRKTTHDDDSTDTDNNAGASQGNPPDHGVPTHSTARFLWEVDKRTPVSELGKLYDRWRDDSEQVDISRWSE
jgi:hypothetical protein